MQKTTKGALAAGAAALLLAGGAGTFAAWQATGGQSGGEDVTTGHLRVTQVPESASWTWQTPGKVGEPFAPGSDTLSPGDSVRFTAQYRLDIEGTNLSAQLVAESGTTGTLPDTVTWTPDAGNELNGLTKAADDESVVTVGGTLAFDESATADMDATVDVDAINVTVKQTSPAVAQ